MKNIKNAGRKLKYGEPTVAMRIPESMVDDIQALLDKRVVLEDIVAYPRNVEHIIESMAQVMNEMGVEVQNTIRETILIAYEQADEQRKPRVLNVLAHWESTIADTSVSLDGYRGVVRGFFDGIVDETKPIFLE